VNVVVSVGEVRVVRLDGEMPVVDRLRDADELAATQNMSVASSTPIPWQ
jgi:hypothetical protein